MFTISISLLFSLFLFLFFFADVINPRFIINFLLYVYLQKIVVGYIYVVQTSSKPLRVEEYECYLWMVLNVRAPMGLVRFVSHKNQFYSHILNEIKISSILTMAFAKCMPFQFSSVSSSFFYFIFVLLLLYIVQSYSVNEMNDELFISSFGNTNFLYRVPYDMMSIIIYFSRQLQNYSKEN